MNCLKVYYRIGKEFSFDSCFYVVGYLMDFSVFEEEIYYIGAFLEVERVDVGESDAFYQLLRQNINKK